MVGFDRTKLEPTQKFKNYCHYGDYESIELGCESKFMCEIVMFRNSLRKAIQWLLVLKLCRGVPGLYTLCNVGSSLVMCVQVFMISC